ncbi:MAG: putative PilT domain containing protein [Candidatus Saccharibacteria bacterium]|nr:putative PilT domain containing protein [Candidatus Saccharibacteria bacterium]
MELLLTAVVLVIAAETSYLVVSQHRKTKHSNKKQMPIFVDTSVLIDGRIVSIAESGFITSTLFIPRSVVGELQFLADNADTDKRSRARHGLDVVSELQALSSVNTEIFNDGTKAEEGVDNRLLKLAKQYKGAICTIDFNLNKVAQVEGITVLNVNDLAMTLRMAYLPGEKTKLEVTQKGNDQHQGIGHLPDGTMVVVEHASQFIGKAVEIEFIRGLQTAAGKMMFARIVGAKDEKQQNKKQAEPRQPKGRLPRPQQPAEEQVVTQPPRQPQQKQPTENTQKSRQNQQRRPNNNNRRRNNEDSLIELANRQ